MSCLFKASHCGRRRRISESRRELWSLLMLLLLLLLPPLPFDFFCHCSCSLPVDALEFDMDVVNSPVEMLPFPIRQKPSGGRLRPLIAGRRWPPPQPTSKSRRQRGRGGRSESSSWEEEEEEKSFSCWTHCWTCPPHPGHQYSGQAPKEEEGRERGGGSDDSLTGPS